MSTDRTLSWRSVFNGGRASLTVGLVMLPSGASAAAASGSDCGNPLRTVVSGRVAGRHSNRGPLVRHLPSGAVMKLTFGAGYSGAGVFARMVGKHWRVCGFRTANDPTWTYAPVSAGALGREFDNDGFTTFTITYARRNARLDGASCANPYVIAWEHGSGDRQAGTVRVTDTTGPGPTETETLTAHWQAKPGYRVCFAAGEGRTTNQPWVDRRQDDGELSHVLNVQHGGDPHVDYVVYFFAAFAKA